MGLYIHSHISLHAVVLTLLSTGATLPFSFTRINLVKMNLDPTNNFIT
jgi:hypothetical protein